MFPNTPVAHERTLRAGASLFLPENCLRISEITEPRDGQKQTSYAKDFTLISALCAFVMSVMPNSLLPSRKELAGPFLQASRAMFRLYEEHDLEHPDSTSLTIRIWHSGAIQNLTGRAGAAWHYHTEASLLALRLRLYDEQAIRRASAVESRLLRANFWLLYMSDKSAAALENRSSVLGEHLFENDLTLLEQGGQHEPLLDETKELAQGALEQRIVFGFHLKTRIWTAAGNLIADIKSYSRRRKHLGLDKSRNDMEVAYMTEANLRFSALTYNLPSWLQNPDSIEAADSRVAAYQKICIWALRSNIMTTYHCLRLVILQKCIDHDLLEIIGLSTQPLSWAMRKVDIVQDFLYELQIVPFLCYKVQGEAGVIRAWVAEQSGARLDRANEDEATHGNARIDARSHNSATDASTPEDRSSCEIGGKRVITAATPHEDTAARADWGLHNDGDEASSTEPIDLDHHSGISTPDTPDANVAEVTALRNRVTQPEARLCLGSITCQATSTSKKRKRKRKRSGVPRQAPGAKRPKDSRIVNITATRACVYWNDILENASTLGDVVAAAVVGSEKRRLMGSIWLEVQHSVMMDMVCGGKDEHFASVFY
ncbi:hypothetical protein DL771_005968 [Monosporascus sp. 5C6A]|nr:hypothetical protein DL771_005968 [Monosporascus sp. 5C6A]